MNTLSIKKEKLIFDTNAIDFNLPYRIDINNNSYVGAFDVITEDNLSFSYFDENDNQQTITLLPTDDIKVYPFRGLGGEHINQERQKIVEPDIKNFYIRNSVIETNDQPLLIMKNDEWVFNTAVIKKYLNMKDILVRINWGISFKALYATDTYAVFPPECVAINSEENLLSCVDKSVKSGYNLKSIHIDSTLWKHLVYAHIEIVDRGWYEGEI